MKMYIGGELVDAKSGATHDVVNPGTEEVVGTIAWADASDAEAALQAADEAFESWSRSPIAERTKWMSKLRDAVIADEENLRELISLEMGKNWAGTEEDYESLRNSLHFYAEEITRLPPRGAGRPRRLAHPLAGQRACRRRRGLHRLELPAAQPRFQDRPGHGRWLPDRSSSPRRHRRSRPTEWESSALTLACRRVR